ncbi:MAG: hypothetical protein M1827_000929 [Pycnora praestabilis]|nr:MAG: hypothetical protein M1827_000929 [Pycnora praestabilis]
MSKTSPYKPSPLSFGSPRSSPFRRPESPASPSTVRATTPTTSPTKPSTPLTSQTQLDPSNGIGAIFTPEILTPIANRELPPSPARGAMTGSNGSPMIKARDTSGDALAKLNPSQVREMREGFQLLDRNNDGQVTRDDVVDMLTNLGQDSSSSEVSQFFPPGQPQTLNLPTFLNTLSTLLAPLSSSQELQNAFAAFDEDDSGQVDLTELRDALLHTSPEPGQNPLSAREIEEVMGGFTGRRTFAKGAAGLGGGNRGEVFRYQEFVGAVSGGAAATDVQTEGAKQ